MNDHAGEGSDSVRVRRRGVSLTTRFLVAMAALFITSLGLIGVVFQFGIVPWHVEAMRQRALNTAGALRAMAVLATPAELQQLVETMSVQDRDLAYVLVVDRDGRAIVHSDRSRIGRVFDDPGTLAAAREGRVVEQEYVRDVSDPRSPHYGERTLDVLVPIQDKAGTPQGAANVGLSLERVVKQQRAYYLMLGILALGLIAAVALTSLRAYRLIFGPLRTMADAARGMQNGNFDVRLPVKGEGEVGELAREFRRMVVRIDELLEEVRKREAELRNFNDQLNSVAAKVSVEGRVLRINAAASRFFGTPHDRFEGQLMWDASVYPASDQARVRLQQAAQQAISGTPARYEERDIQANTGTRVILISTHPVFDEAGTVDYVVVEATDITERVRVEQALRDSEASYRALAEHAQDFIFAIDRHGRYRYANQALTQFVGEPLVGKTLVDLLGPDEGAYLIKCVEQTLATGQSMAFEGRTGFRGEERWYDTRLVPVEEFQGRHQLVLGITRDATERKRIQARLLLADRMVSVGTLAAGVAHEINNPLTYVMGNLSLAQEMLREQNDPLSAQLLRMLEDAMHGATRVSSIVRDLKSFARTDEERIGAIDVRGVLESSIQMAHNEIRHRARLETHFGPAPKVRANEGRLGQVLVNLLINAAHAMASGSAERNLLTVRLDTDERGWARVEVTDTGSGIKPEHLKRLYDPFFTTKPVGQGTGLGLFVCKNIVDSLGGEIEIRSQKGQGTSARVSLPPDPGTRELVPSPLPPPPVGPRARVLVIDDDERVCSLVVRALHGSHEVVAETSAENALQRLREGESFDLIVCDLMMPALSGMEFYERLKQFNASLAQRTVMMTGGAFTESDRDFLDRVKLPRLIKPFTPEGLLQSVSQWLAQVEPERWPA